MLVTALSTQTIFVQCSKGGATVETVGHVGHSTQHPTVRVQLVGKGEEQTAKTVWTMLCLVTALSTQPFVSSDVRDEQLLKQLDMLVTALSTQLLVSSDVREEQIVTKHWT